MLYKTFISIVLSAILGLGIVFIIQSHKECYSDDDMLENEEVLYSLIVDNTNADIVFTSQSECNYYQKLFTTDNPMQKYRCHEVMVVLRGDIVNF